MALEEPLGGAFDALIVGDFALPVELFSGFFGGEEDVTAHEPDAVSGDEGGFFEVKEASDDFEDESGGAGELEGDVARGLGYSKGVRPEGEVLALGDVAVIADVVGLAYGDVVVGGEQAGVSDISGVDGVESVVAGAEDFDFSGGNHAVESGDAEAIAGAVDP